MTQQKWKAGEVSNKVWITYWYDPGLTVDTIFAEGDEEAARRYAEEEGMRVTQVELGTPLPEQM